MGMALLADEELQGVIPKKTEDKSNQWQDWGYYRDERGITRYGVIPKQNNNIIASLENHDYYGIRTSDQRIYQGYY